HKGTSPATAGLARVRGTATHTETPGPVAPVLLDLNPSAIPASPTSTSKATATVLDVNKNAEKSETITFKTDGDATFTPVSNNGDGTYTTTIIGTTSVAHIENITATDAAAGKSSTAPLSEPAGPA